MKIPDSAIPPLNQSEIAALNLPRAAAGGVDCSSPTALRVSEIRYRRLFETARDGVLLVDPATRKITDANPFMTELLGYSHAEFIGMELWEIGLLKDQQASQEMFRELQEKRFIRYEDLPLKSIRGQTREVEVVANVYQEDQQQVIQCNIRDITERKRGEHELASAKEEISRHTVKLEETVKIRTAQLRETIGELESFSYSISHDIRAPLRTMRGYAEILLDQHSSQLNAEASGYLRRISGAGARMDKLIQEVLIYTRVLRSEVKMAPVDLDSLVRQIVETYPHLQDDVEIQITGRLLKIMGGEASVAQCVSNLLTNAVKFVAPGTTPRVKIWAEPKGGDVRLWVEDNGVGIAPEDQARIFNMFERIDCDTAYDGTGMGLAIVNKAVERMGGRRGVESEVGHGSKFWIQLKGVAA